MRQVRRALTCVCLTVPPSRRNISTRMSCACVSENVLAAFRVLWLTLLQELPEKDGLSVKHMLRTKGFIHDRLPDLTPRVDTQSKHILSLTCPRTCSHYSILALVSHNCVNVTAKRLLPQIICPAGHYDNAHQHPSRCSWVQRGPRRVALGLNESPRNQVLLPPSSSLLFHWNAGRTVCHRHGRH